MIVQGARIHGVSELYWQQNSDGISVDPGPVYGDQADQFHNDGIQLGTYGWKPTIVDSWSEGRIMFNKAVHPTKSDWDMRVRRVWFGPTLLTGTDGAASKVMKLTDNAAFADWLKGDTAGAFPSQPAMVVASTTRYGNPAEQMSGEFTGITYIRHSGTPVLRLVEGKSNASAYSNLKVDSAVTKTFGYGTKSLFLSGASKAIAADSQNPANIWRKANPYSTLSTFTGLTKADFRPE